MKKILLLATFLTVTSIGHAQVLILQDTFNRGTPSDPVALNGTSPGYTVAPETWTADSSITTDGSSAFVPGTSTNDPDDGVTGYIGIPGVTGGNLTVGKTYTLQLTFSQAHGGGAWTAAGFGTETNTADWPGAGGNYAGFWAIDNGGGVAIQYQGTTIFYDGLEPGNVDVVLTVKVGVSSDLLSATINGVPRTLTISNAPLAPISDVFVGDVFNTNGGFSNLSVTEDVPEPSTWAMLIGGASVLLVVQRLRRKLSV